MSARLHHERVARSTAAPAAWLLLTHGIYGAGSNWRGVARKLVDRRPEWGVVLADLRHHGRSEGGAPPHTIEAAAGDALGLVAELAAGGAAVRALAGHSFGGKVMLAARALAAAAPGGSPIAQTYVLDASPSARPGALADPGSSVVAVLALMERLPTRWARRDDFVAAVVGAGHDVGLAQWLAMNVVPAASGAELALRLDLGAIRALLADYFARDLWSSVLDPAGGAVHLVVAERAEAVSAADRARLAAAPPHVHTHYVAAGHWLHIDAPEAVVEILAAALPDAS